MSPAGSERVADHLETVRTEMPANAIAVAGVAVVGLLAAWLHWTGLLVAGILIGVVSRSLPAAALTALGFGALVMVAFVVSQGPAALGYHELTPIIYVTVASAFGLPLLGSLVRGL